MINSVLLDLIKQNDYQSILCLNGKLPDKEFFQAIHLPVVAADGGANQLEAIGVKPIAIVGDLDSVEAAVRARHTVIHDPDQDTCDYEKTLAYLKKQNLLPAIVVGIDGGCLDHVIRNISVFMQTGRVFYCPPVVGFCLQAGETKKLSLEVNTKVSLFGLPNAIISTTGLKWELDQYELSFPGKNSSSNRALKEEVTVQVDYGLALAVATVG